MKRLIKLNESEFTYKFESPITVNIGDQFTWKAEEYTLTSGDEFESVIKEAVNDSMSELGPKGLATYADNRISNEVNSIIVTVQNGKAITIVKSNKELNDNDLENIKEYIKGQLGDGWGEGFEQTTLDSWTETTEDENWNEDEQEIEMVESEYTATMTASFYGYKGWYIKLV